ncbi:dihydrolipoyl dehydrogenase [Phocicoccus pinnipedialis]|uniref:Dihydrolipoyl dehydrogenase n=2 Tax=Phocicoccus pinnipedialis TaxID=110845 RepID=A0A6V7RDK8_9BACL|nr:dihydrolipoyl dehydrogenase [Jeotgalicoccus pinnipedialis]MBP1939329.1 dihydrolipoamide dehydrogenase [Jeotgalicoccus pinnipedialis]CAD2075847.1 Dihydrolipoyl dehydrogenase [Jeotgalicoccus pinnipedialis]
MTKHYDLVVIGGGTGGYVSAIRASQLGLSVAIVEKQKLGGTCLHRGCIPTKSLLKSADLIEQIKITNELGITDLEINFDYKKIVARKDKIVDQMYKGIHGLIKKNKIDVFNGHGRMLGPSIFSPISGTVAVEREDGESDVLTNDYVLIATGTTPRELPYLEFDNKIVISSDHILTQETLPESILIIGGGVIGVEFASLLSDLGVNVTIVDVEDRLLKLEDKDASRIIEDTFKKKNVAIHTSTRLVESDFTKNESSMTVELDGKSVEFDQVLVAIGRVPLTDDIGLSNTKIKTDKGYIETSEFYQTAESHIYAIGDCIGKLQLAHVATKEGLIAVEKIAHQTPIELDYRAVPRCVYTNPEIASIGFTEDELKESNTKYKAHKFPLVGVAKAVIENDGVGFVKLLVDEHESILGATIVGAHATELINELSLAKFLDVSMSEMKETIHAHPSVGEGIFEASLDALGMAIHK